jgi:prepilin-type N-terminal cleavage/methylation domain-containing protein
MSSRCRRPSSSAGFTLTEVLVALAIAAMLSSMLVRFVAGTRANARRVGEAVEMATLAETLLARMATAQDVQPGRTAGRSGNFRWEMVVRPLAHNAVARRVNEPEKPNSAEAGNRKGGFSERFTLSMKVDTPDSQPATSRKSWVVYQVAVAVEAPSGRTHVADTLKIGSPAAERQ